MLLTIDKHRNKNSKKTVFSIAICRPTGQSSTMFLTIFDLRSSIVLTFSICYLSGVVSFLHRFKNFSSSG